MLIRKAQTSDIKEIILLMKELNEFRKSIISENNEWFHEKINQQVIVDEKEICESILFIAISQWKIIWYI